MLLYSKILVPIDGSKISLKTLDAALFLSEKLGSGVTVIYVMEDIPITHIESQKLLKTLTELLEASKKAGEDILSECLDVATKRGLKISTVLLQGNPASKILDFSINEKYDLIIIGSRGKGMIKELLLGSVSSKILHTASCPVLIIR